MFSFNIEYRINIEFIFLLFIIFYLYFSILLECSRKKKILCLTTVISRFLVCCHVYIAIYWAMLITKLYRRPSGTCSLCHVTQIQANKKPRATSKMASPPLSSSGDRCWTEEKERALIAFFSSEFTETQQTFIFYSNLV